MVQAPREVFWLGLTLFGLAPGLLLTGVALRLGGDRRDRAVLTLRMLGASRRAVAGTAVRALVGPITAGAAGGFLALVVASLRDWTIPVVDYALASADMRPGLGYAALAVVVVAGAALTAGVLLHQPRREGSQGANVVVSVRRPRGAVLWGVVGAMATANWAHLAFHDSAPQLALYARLACASVVVVLLAPAAAPLVTGLAGAVGAIARRTGSAGGLVAGRDIARHSRAAVRVSTVASLLIVLGFQTQVLIAEGDSVVREAASQYQANNDQVLMVQSINTEASTTWVDSLLDAHPKEFGVLVFTSGDEETTLRGHCASLLVVVRTCPESDGMEIGSSGPARPELRLYGVTDRTHLVAIDTQPTGSAAAEVGDTLLFVSRDGAPVEHAAVIRELGRWVQPVPLVEAAGQSETLGAIEGARSTEWLVPGMILASVLALSTAVAAMLLELVRSAARSRAFFTWARRRDVLVFAVCSVGAPTLLAVALGLTAGAGLVAAAVSDPTSHTTITAAGLWAIASAGLAACVTGTGLAYLLLARQRPGAV